MCAAVAGLSSVAYASETACRERLNAAWNPVRHNITSRRNSHENLISQADSMYLLETLGARTCSRRRVPARDAWCTYLLETLGVRRRIVVALQQRFAVVVDSTDGLSE